MGDTITQIGRYEISRQLVDTALASVYDAFDPVERKPVAIRVPRTTQTHATGALGLKHPGLMTVLSYEQSQGAPFLVLEPFEGKPLDSQIPAVGPMDPAEVLALLHQLASALDYAHAHGSLHGSLHPSGILLNDRHEIKVLDLGSTDIAGLPASAEQLLRAVHFLSPECIRDTPMDGRSDQFSLAVLALRMLTGELPFPGTPLGVMFRIAYQGLERDTMLALPVAAQSIFRRALAKSPADRYDTCGEMVDALEAALNRAPVAATRLADASQFLPPRASRLPAESAIRAPKSRSREALKYFGVTFVVCAAILAALFYLLLPRTSHQSTVTAPTPAVTQAPAVSRPSVQQTPAKAESSGNAKPAARSRGGKKKNQPELELKPVEPKIIRQ